MPRRQRNPKALAASRFSRTIEEEVSQGICWEDLHWRLSPFLTPPPDASPERAARLLAIVRAYESAMDGAQPGSPGNGSRQPPSWPHWTGTDR